ncbi:MAG: hypothetical protein WAU77_04190 [Solirubrobacteraceae bacterium]
MRGSVRALAHSALIIGALTVAVMLVSVSSALAVSGIPINVGTPFESEPPAVAVDAAGDAIVAWANTKDLPPNNTNVLQYCVLPVGATGCVHSNTLVPAAGGEHIDRVQVLVDGSTIVLLADVYGTHGSKASDYEPEQEWQSTDGGATFSIVDGGLSVASGILSAGTKPLSAVILPGTNVLGYGWDTAGSSPPTFSAFPLSSPPECSAETCPAGFASLEPNTNPDQIGNDEGQFASQEGPNSGVMGVFKTDFTNGPLGCSSSETVPFGTAYAFASGPQSSSNNYNISPGEPNSAWKVPVTQADCNVDYFALAGGPSGFGVLEDSELAKSIVYHRFDQATETFDTPFTTIAANAFEESSAISQDGLGGIYATFLLGGPGGQIALAYSSNGGASWTGPATLNPNADEGAEELTSSVNASGQGWATWMDNGSIYAQPFIAADAISPVVVAPPAADTLTTSQTSGTTTGASIMVAAGTVGETDRATLSGANAAIATGTVTYGLFSNPTCTASSKVFSGGTVGVTTGVAASSAAVTTALAQGTYYWQATYSGDAHNVASTSACGSEVLTVVPATLLEGKGTSTGASVTITITCASTPCTVTITITIAESSGKAAAARKKKAKRPKIVTLATGKFTITTPGAHKLTLHLTKDGKRLFARDHGRLKAKVLVAEKTAGGLETTTRTVSFTPAKTKHKHKK